MKSPAPEVIFSPRRNEGNIFNFSPNLQQQWRPRYAETERAEGVEQSPMLRTSRNSTESNGELDHVSGSNRGLFNNLTPFTEHSFKGKYRRCRALSAFFF
jgi:hypothetical protein